MSNHSESSMLVFWRLGGLNGLGSMLFAHIHAVTIRKGFRTSFWYRCKSKMGWLAFGTLKLVIYYVRSAKLEQFTMGCADEQPPWPTLSHAPNSPIPNLQCAPSPVPPTPEKGLSTGLYGKEPQIYGRPEAGLTVVSNRETRTVSPSEGDWT
ncbi:hypothetical protein PM082_021550 [Marasmius tenuissimus]|nr:hypothetical protein PM082_021550 [Marasmius tenuissimus]